MSSAFQMWKARGRKELCKSIPLLMISTCSSPSIVPCNAGTERVQSAQSKKLTFPMESQMEVKNEKLPVNGETVRSLLLDRMSAEFCESEFHF